VIVTAVLSAPFECVAADRTRPWQSMVLPSLTSLKVPINLESGLVKAVTRNPAQSNSLVVFIPFAISSMICLFSA